MDDSTAIGGQGPGQGADAAKAAHDAVHENLTADSRIGARLPDLTPGPATDEAIAYVMTKGYTREAAVKIVQETGVDAILTAQAHEAPGKRIVEGIVGAAENALRGPKPVPVNRYNERFEPELHAANPDGSPKEDSAGRYILREHDYQPRTPNIPGGK